MVVSILCVDATIFFNYQLQQNAETYIKYIGKVSYSSSE